MQCTEIDAPSRIHRLIIGKKGVNIRELQDAHKQVSHCYIFEKEIKRLSYDKLSILFQCHIEFTADKIRVEAPPDSIDEVKRKLLDKVNYYLNEYDAIELEVNRDHFKHIIGKQGGNGQF